MEKRIYLDPELVRELLDYDPETGVLTWRKRDGRHFSTRRGWAIWNARYAGMEAGSIRTRRDGYKYRRIGLFNVDVMAHRIAWVCMTGEQPPHEIDHINKDATDCRWSNLRDGTGTNQRNKTRMKNNTSGYPGVSRHTQAPNRWCARVMIGGKMKHLGMAGSAEAAYELVKAAYSKNGFSEDHGISDKPY